MANEPKLVPFVGRCAHATGAASARQLAEPSYLQRSMPAPNTSLLDSALLEPILLRKASRRARALPESARARMRPWVKASRVRYSVALELRHRDQPKVALGLLRDAAFFALCALEVGEPAAPPPTTSAKVAWERFNQLPESAEAPPMFAVARSAFARDEALAVETLDANEVSHLRAAAEQTVAWLLALTEVHTPQRLTRMRRVRTLLLGVGLTVIAWTGFSYWLALAALAHLGG